MREMWPKKCFVCWETDPKKFKPLAWSIHWDKWLCDNPNCFLLFVHLNNKEIDSKRGTIKNLVYDRGSCIEYLNLNEKYSKHHK